MVLISLQFLELIRTVPQFGFVQLDSINISHPEANSEGFLRIGDDHLLVYTKKSPTSYQVYTYKVQRIKCWKVSTLVSLLYVCALSVYVCVLSLYVCALSLYVCALRLYVCALSLYVCALHD